MKDKRLPAYIIMAAATALWLWVGLAPHAALTGWRTVDGPVHSAMEALGGMAAVVMAVFLLQRERERLGWKLFVISTGFLSMGVLDGLHSVSTPGHGLVLLHSLSVLFGGFWFAMVWVPAPDISGPAKRSLPLAVMGVVLLLGFWIMQFRETFPAMAAAGGFTPAAKALNMLGGAAFMAASARLLLDFHRSGELEHCLFACLALLFGVAGMTFANSSLWDGVWWFWHLERFGAYVIVSGWVMSRHGRDVYELRAALAEKERAERELSEHKDELEAALESLEHSEELFRSVAKTAVDAIVVVDASGSIAFWNQGAEAMFGYAEDEAVGRPLDIIIPERYREGHAGAMAKAAERGGLENPGRPVELSGLRKDGGEFPLELSLAQWRTADGTFFTAIVRDITERRLAEEEKHTVVNMLAHDIKTPLSVITGYCELLVERRGGEFPEEELGEIKKSADRIAALITDMLTISKAESGGIELMREPVSVSEVLRQAVRESEIAAARKGVTIEVEIDDLPVVHADGMQLGRAFGNLVANAVKYNRHGGKVRVCARANPEGGGGVDVEVSDDGMGIHPEDLPHVFEKFYRGRKSGATRGTGLGLAVVKAVVEAHGGKASAYSGESGGAEFRITIPAGAPRMSIDYTGG